MSRFARLLSALPGASDIDIDVVGLLDALWLAALANPNRAISADDAPQPNPAAITDTGEPTTPPTPTPPTPRPASPTPQRGRLHLGAPDEPAVSVLLPAPALLADARAIIRALRPLRRRRVVPGEGELDVAATLQSMSAGVLWEPKFRPRTERSFALQVVVDRGGAWPALGEAIQALVAVVARMGAWRHVTLLRVDDEPIPVLRKGLTGSTVRSPRSLADASGRTITLVVTDATRDAWRTGHLAELLASASAPALLVTLPGRLWPQTGLLGYVDASAREDLDDEDLDDEDLVGQPMALVALGRLDAWARAKVTGSKFRPYARLRRQPARTPAPAPDGDAIAIHYLRYASPAASRLALLLAWSPSPWVDVALVRLIRTAMVPNAVLSDEVEVLLGGLLRPEQSQPARFTFKDGVRTALRIRGNISDGRQVAEQVSAWLQNHWGEARSFVALLRDPHSAGAMRADDLPFAELARELLEDLGGAWARAVSPVSPEPVELPRPLILEFEVCWAAVATILQHELERRSSSESPPTESVAGLLDSSDIPMHGTAQLLHWQLAGSSTSGITPGQIQESLRFLRDIAERYRDEYPIEYLRSLSEAELERTVEAQVGNTIQEVLESGRVIDEIAETNAGGYAIDEYEITDIHLEDDECRATISYTALGDQSDERMYLGHKISGTAEAVIDSNGLLHYLDVTARVRHDITPDDAEDVNEVFRHTAEHFSPPDILRILLVSADPLPWESPPLETEFSRITDRLRHRRNVHVHQRTWLTINDLHAALLDVSPHILHFSGHGTADYLLLQSDRGGDSPTRVSSSMLVRTLRASASELRLVVLNSDDSLPIVMDIVAASGADWAIGMQGPILDDDAINFSSALYDALAAGRSLRSAFERARARLMSDNPSNDPSPHLVPDDMGRAVQVRFAPLPAPSIIDTRTIPHIPEDQHPRPELTSQRYEPVTIELRILDPSDPERLALIYPDADKDVHSPLEDRTGVDREVDALRGRPYTRSIVAVERQSMSVVGGASLHIRGPNAPLPLEDAQRDNSDLLRHLDTLAPRGVVELDALWTLRGYTGTALTAIMLLFAVGATAALGARTLLIASNRYDMEVLDDGFVMGPVLREPDRQGYMMATHVYSADAATLHGFSAGSRSEILRMRSALTMERPMFVTIIPQA